MLTGGIACLDVQRLAPVLVLAFLVVGGTVALLIPIMLYVLQLHTSGWTWQWVAMFGSMLASTDAVAIISTMKTSNLNLSPALGVSVQKDFASLPSCK